MGGGRLHPSVVVLGAASRPDGAAGQEVGSLVAASAHAVDRDQPPDESQRAIVATSRLRQLVRERLSLSDEPSLQRLALRLVNELPVNAVHEAAFKGILEILGEEERGRRSSARRGGVTTPRRAAGTLRAVAIRYDLYSLRYPTPDGPKLLGDFTRADSEWTMGQYKASAAADLREAARFKAIAQRTPSGRTVREAITHADLEEIFHA